MEKDNQAHGFSLMNTDFILYFKKIFSDTLLKKTYMLLEMATIKKLYNSNPRLYA